MQLILVRHAAAIEYETKTVRSDELRFLTSEGRSTARKFFGQLKDKIPRIDKIFTSPLIRAVQTAEIFSSVTEFEGDVEIVNELRSDSSTASMISLIGNNKFLNCIVLVGHEPTMGILVNSVCVKIFNGKAFRKCGVAIIDYSPDTQNGKLISYTDPKS